MINIFNSNDIINYFNDLLKKVIHEKGGRKIGITTLTSLGCLLAVRVERPDNTCDEKLNIISSLHDKALSKKLQDLTQQWEGFMYSKFELQTEITKRMKNPSKYGCTTPEFQFFS